jgi:hypothetical protein
VQAGVEGVAVGALGCGAHLVQVGVHLQLRVDLQRGRRRRAALGLLTGESQVCVRGVVVEMEERKVYEGNGKGKCKCNPRNQ